MGAVIKESIDLSDPYLHVHVFSLGVTYPGLSLR